MKTRGQKANRSQKIWDYITPEELFKFDLHINVKFTFSLVQSDLKYHILWNKVDSNYLPHAAAAAIYYSIYILIITNEQLIPIKS